MTMKGFSFMIAFGKPCRPKIQVFCRMIRVVFGPVAVYVGFLDLDALMVTMSHRLPDPEKP